MFGSYNDTRLLIDQLINDLLAEAAENTYANQTIDERISTLRMLVDRISDAEAREIKMYEKEMNYE